VHTGQDLVRRHRLHIRFEARHAPVLARGARAVAWITLLALAACDRGKQNDRDPINDPNGEALAAPAKPQEPPYSVRALDAFGRATGFVELDGPPPNDSVIQPPADQPACGPAFTRRGIERRGNRVVGVVVWIDGLRSGKALPIERRFEIANDRCMLVPEVQAAIAGGRLNVQNLDPAEHRTRITRRDGGEVLATIRETDEGQVVPNEHVLARPGILELTCEVHPWTRAWIAAFDHPYYTMTGDDGSFSIDSVPPGTYRVHAWHPRLGPVEQSLTIEAGKTVSLVLRARAGSM